MTIKKFTVRFDSDVLEKLRVIADYEGRTVNSQMLILVRDCIAAYEKAHGEIRTGAKE